jgi:hypothetical protein
MIKERHRLYMGYSATIPVNKEKIGQRTKNLNELSDPGGLNGSPTDSETGLQRKELG